MMKPSQVRGKSKSSGVSKMHCNLLTIQEDARRMREKANLFAGVRADVLA